MLAVALSPKSMWGSIDCLRTHGLVWTVATCQAPRSAESFGRHSAGHRDFGVGTRSSQMRSADQRGKR